jgi:hypothetical protein
MPIAAGPRRLRRCKICYHEQWPRKGITLFETCFVPAGLQGDIAHATKLRRDSEYKSGILYSVVVVHPE